MKHFLIGELRLNESLSKIDYFIFNPVRTESTSISKILDNIYKQSPTKEIRLSIKYSSEGESHFCNPQGKLHKSTDKYGIKSYHIGNYEIESKLDSLVGEKVEIFIEDFLDKKDEEFYIYDRIKS